MEKYYKVLAPGMIAKDMPSYVYKPGLNEPRLGKIEGILLWKSLDDAIKEYRTGDEVYLAEPGVILREQLYSIQVAYCFIRERVPTETVNRIWHDEMLIKSHNLVCPPICGLDWLKEHEKDHTQQEIDSLEMVIITPTSKTTLKAGMKAKDVREAIKARVG